MQQNWYESEITELSHLVDFYMNEHLQQVRTWEAPQISLVLFFYTSHIMFRGKSFPQKGKSNKYKPKSQRPVIKLMYIMG